MIFDDVRRLMLKKKISFKEKCRFLAQVPDATLMAGCDPNPEAIERFYTKDDVNDLFEYWFSSYKSMMEERNYLWK